MKKFIIIITIQLFIFITCKSNSQNNYVYKKPMNLNDGLTVGNLPDTKIKSQLIYEAINQINKNKFGEIHSFLIYKDNMLVLEKYFKGHKYKWDAPYYHGSYIQWNSMMPHQIMSCTKSFTSACISIAIKKGYIKDVNESIFNYLPDYQQFKTGGKEKITIEHLLTMTSGLKWNEWNAPHATAANDIDRLYFECSNDPVYCVFERPLVKKPGTFFTYNGGGFIILGEILKNATNKDIFSFAKEYLFSPLQINARRWDGFPKGQIEAAGGLHLISRDMLKFGILYLQDGKWGENQILTSEWVHKSSTVYNNNKNIKIPIEDSGKNGYGYSWWISNLKNGKNKILMYRANGWGGQVIMVLPEYNTVIVFTSGNYTSKSKLFKILYKYILPAL